MLYGVASRLAPLLTRILGAELPIRVQAWDGSVVGPPDAPTFVIRNRQALRRLLWQPGEVGLVRAYVAGELDIEGDIVTALAAVRRVMRDGDAPIRLSSDDKREIVRTAVMLGAVGPEPKPPPEELPLDRPPEGSDDLMAGQVGEAGTLFFQRMLGSTMAYASAYWGDDPSEPVEANLDEAQRSAQDALAHKLGLAADRWLLDVGCGWGSFVIYAAERYGVRAIGLTPSQEQADHAQKQVARAGLTDRVEIRVGDYQAAGAGPYHAIVALSGRVGRHAAELYSLLASGGRLLIQQTTRRPGPHAAPQSFIAGFRLPRSGESLPVGELVTLLEGAGMEVRSVTALREQYARTLRAWAGNLQRHEEEAAQLTSPGSTRVWLLHLAASALACESGHLGLHEVCAVRRDPAGRASR